MGLFNFFEPNIKRLKKEQNINGLFKALFYHKNDKSALVRREAADALWTTFQTVKAVEPLLDALNDEDKYVREKVHSLLEREIDAVPSRRLLEILENKKHNGRKIAADLLCIKADENITKELISHLRDQDYSIAQTVAKTLALIGSKETLKPLLSYLEEKPGWALIPVIRTVGKIGGNESVKTLIKFIKHDDFNVRQEVINSLIEIGTEETFKPLVSLLETNDEVRFLSLAGESNLIKDKRFIEPFINLLKKNHGHSNWIAHKIIPQLGSKAVMPLIQTLNDQKSYDYKKMIILSLREIRDERAIPYLTSALKDEDTPKIFISNVLLDLGWHPEGYEQKCWYLIGKEDWDAIVKMGSEAINVLSMMLGAKDLSYKGLEKVIELLDKIGGTETFEILQYIFKNRYHLLKQPGKYSEIGRCIVNIFMETGNKAVAEDILDFLFEHKFCISYFHNDPQPEPICPKNINDYFEDYADFIYNSVQYYNAYDHGGYDCDPASTNFVRENQIDAIKNLCGIKTTISNNILIKFVEKIKESEKIFIPSIKLAKEELYSRNNPKYDVSAYKEKYAWKIHQ